MAAVDELAVSLDLECLGDAILESIDVSEDTADAMFDCMLDGQASTSVADSIEFDEMAVISEAILRDQLHAATEPTPDAAGSVDPPRQNSHRRGGYRHGVRGGKRARERGSEHEF